LPPTPSGKYPNYWYVKLDYEKANQYYEETIRKSEIDPLSSDDIVGRAYGALGNIALANSEFEEAIEAFTQAIEQDAEFPGYYFARASAKIEAGLPDEGRADLELCVALGMVIK
jgi:tetratricopeptide (TPR) repeat protein